MSPHIKGDLDRPSLVPVSELLNFFFSFLRAVLVSPPEERKYKCHLCPYAAKCRANLNQHLTVHSVKLVSTDTEDIVSAVTSEGSDGKKHPYYYRLVTLAAARPSFSDPSP